MSDAFSIKRGESFSVDGAYVDDAGDPVDLTNYEITSQVRKLGNVGDLVVELTISLGDQGTDPGTFTMSASTDAWPLGLLACDVRFVVGGVVTYTNTFQINVVAQVTR